MPPLDSSCSRQAKGGHITTAAHSPRRVAKVVQFSRRGPPMCRASARYARRQKAMTPVLNHTHTSETHAAAPAGPTVAIIGAPSGLGAPTPGQEAGPAALRAAGLAARLHAAHTLVVDWGDVVVPGPDPIAVPTARNQDALAALAGAVAARVGAALDDGFLPLLLGGDHSVSLGAIRAAAARMPIGVLWFDAHGDFNTPETSPSGNVHGMVLAVLVGRGEDALVHLGGRSPKVRESHAVLVGVRDLDAAERAALRESAVTVFTMKEIDELGIAAVVRQALEVATGRGVRPVHLSFDLDVVDPVYAPGVATAVDGGLSFREAHLAMELIGQSRALVSMELVEVNPILDRENRTGRLAAGLAASALGKRIL